MWEDAFLTYLRYERNYSAHTIKAYKEDIAQLKGYILEGYGVFDPVKLETDQIREWVVYLMDQGYSPTSVNRKLSAVRAFYKYLLLSGKVQKDPLCKINGPKRKKPLPGFVKEGDMDHLLEDSFFEDDFEGKRDKLIIEMFYTTGIRLAELVGLDNVDVDCIGCTLKVTGKRNKQRIIPFGQELRDNIIAYQTIRDAMVEKRCEAFFVRKNGLRVYRNLIYNVVRRNLSKVVTLQKRSPHVLRHTFATVMLNNNATLDAVKEILGHSSVATTEIYTHMTFEELKKVYKQAHPRA